MPLPDTESRSKHPLALYCLVCHHNRKKVLVAQNEDIFRIYRGNYWANSVSNTTLKLEAVRCLPKPTLRFQKRISKYKSNFDTGNLLVEIPLLCSVCETEIGYKIPNHRNS